VKTKIKGMVGGQSVEGVKFSKLDLGDDVTDVGAYVKSGLPEVDIYPIDDPVNQFFKLFHGTASLEGGMSGWPHPDLHQTTN
jgi:hypothetical protein